MARYWPGRSLLELYRGEMSWRELRVFLRHLPQDSATARKINPDNAWSLDQQLTAAAVDGINFLGALTLYVNGDPKSRGKFKPPEPVDRPGVRRRPAANTIRFGGRHGSGAAQLAAVFGGASRQ